MQCKLLVSLFMLVVSLAFTTHAEAQSVKNGGPNGKIVSGFSLAPAAGGSPVNVFTADLVENTIITQMCAAANNGISATYSVDWSGSTLGTMGDIGRDNSTGVNLASTPVCITYSPGLVVPKGEIITCQETSGGSTVACTVSGFQTKK